MVLWLLSGLAQKPKGIRRLRSTWRRHQLKAKRKHDLAEFARTLKNERGSVESALVVIPLLTLFLISFQLVLTINNRNIEVAYAQSSATHSAISGRFQSGDRVIDLNTVGPFNELRAVVSTNTQNLPNLVPFIGSKDRIVKVQGFSILESQS
jgi:hypothetical protein